MSCTSPLPLLLGVVVMALLGLMILGAIRARDSAVVAAFVGTQDNLLLGLLVLAAFASGVFSTLVLLAFQTR